jgi:D-alanyl-D-alanine carboxypeptidase
MPQPIFSPVPVYIGPAPGYIGPVAQARPAHSPIGTEPPPETASAYAAPPLSLDAAKNPLKPDPAALPIRGRHPAALAGKPKARPVTASAEAETKTADTAAKKISPKKTIKQAHAETSKPAKVKEAKSAHTKDHLAPEVKAKPETGAAAE